MGFPITYILLAQNFYWNKKFNVFVFRIKVELRTQT